MPITTSGTSVTFNDTTVQTTSARNGAVITSSGTDITLTLTSKQAQQINMTATGLAVILPNATTYVSDSLGGPVFTITNAGGNYFDIENSSGFVVFGLDVGQSCTISLAGNTTQNQWVGALASNTFVSSTRGLSGVISTTVPAFGNPVQNMQVAALSSSLIVAVWRNGTTNHSFAAAGSISGSTITWGTPTAISVVRAYDLVNIAALSSTTALIMSTQAGVGAYFNGISVSGTTITVSTISAASGTGDNVDYPMQPLTSTTAIYFYGNTAVGIVGRVITYNGASAPTFGTALNNPNTGGPRLAIAVLSPTSVICFGDNSGTNYNARIWTVSGTTLTFGTNLILPQTNFSGGAPSLIKISATEVIFTTDNAISGAVQKFTISGTTITASTVWQFQSYHILGQNGGANYLLSATDFLATTGGTRSPFATVPFTKYSYNTTTGVSVLGVSPFPVLLVLYGYCQVTTNTAAVVGLNSLNQPSGYLVYIT